MRSRRRLQLVSMLAPMLAGCDAVLGIPDPVHAPADAGAGPAPGWYELPEVPAGFGPRGGHSAIWTGREMIIWGGVDPDDPAGALRTGAAFDAGAGSWRTIPDAPIEGRWGHVTAWTGKYMLVWGGIDLLGNTYFLDGAAYDPEADTWTVMRQPTGFVGRAFAEAAWATTTHELIVWGGETKGGLAAQDGMAFRLDPNAGAETGGWTTLVGAGDIEGRSRAPTVWMGARMIFIGGDKCLTSSPSGGCRDGAAYDPTADAWESLSPLPSVFEAPLYHVGVATDAGRATFWGGYEQDAGYPPVYSSGGASYDDATRTWSDPLPDPGGSFAITKRVEALAWYGGGKMFVWGGKDIADNLIGTGGAYDFATSAWSALPNDGAPTPRTQASAVWSGDSAIVFGGLDQNLHPFADGRIYRP